MDKLKALLAHCKCGVILTINDHRNVYVSAEEALDDLMAQGFGVSKEIAEKIIETDTIVDLHFYPDTPVGFYKVLHYDIEAALDEALACFSPNA